MKKLLFTGISLFTVFVILMAGCKKENPGDTKPPYYFRYYANGEYIEYQCKFTEGYLGGWNCPYSASAPGSSTTVSHYSIYGRDLSDIPGGMSHLGFYLNPDDFSTMDSILLDGERNSAYVDDLQIGDGKPFDCEIDPPLSGKIIFTERTDDYLKGKFEFEAFKYIMGESGVSEITDTIIYITSGEFYVPCNFN